MKVKQLIEILKTYPQDEEVYIGDMYDNNPQIIFKIHEVKDYLSTSKSVRLCEKPYSVDDIKTFEDIGENTWYNRYDEFDLYDYESGDLIKLNNDSFEVVYKNLNKNYDRWSECAEYKNPDFMTVGGLKKFLNYLDEDMKINLKSGYDIGVINSIRKGEVCYLVGTYDDVDEECREELFIELGLELFGGGIISLNDSSLPFKSKEVQRVIAKPIIKRFNELGVDLTEEESLQWGQVVEDILMELNEWYEIKRRINGSRDCNGYIHLYDKENPFKIAYETEVKIKR